MGRSFTKAFLLALAVLSLNAAVAFSDEVSNPTLGSGAAAINQTAGSNQIYMLPGQAVITREAVGNTIIEIGGVYTWLAGANKGISIEAPTAGTVWSRQTANTIKWKQNNMPSDAVIVINYSRNDGAIYQNISDDTLATAEQYVIPAGELAVSDPNKARIYIHCDDPVDTTTEGFTVVDIPPGTVPLYISRVDSDILITWEAAYSNPKIFALTGDGSGVYHNDYNTAQNPNWTQLTENGALLTGLPGTFQYNEAEHRLRHQEQVGKGYSEVYYKGLQNDITDLVYYIPSAEAAGKVTAEARLDWNLISPVLLGDSINSALGQSFLANDELWKWDSSSNQRLNKIAYYNGSVWALMPGYSEADFKNGEGYGLNLLNLPGGVSSRIITLVGKVRATDFSSTINKDWNKLGQPFPYRISLNNGSGLGHGVSHIGDQFWSWDLANSKLKLEGIFSGAQWNNDFGLRPGIGYGYSSFGPSEAPWVIEKQ